MLREVVSLPKVTQLLCDRNCNLSAGPGELGPALCRAEL